MEVGWGWCRKGECVEGPGVDGLAIAHRAHDSGLPLDSSDAEVLSLHLPAVVTNRLWYVSMDWDCYYMDWESFKMGSAILGPLWFVTVRLCSTDTD